MSDIISNSFKLSFLTYLTMLSSCISQPLPNATEAANFNVQALTPPYISRKIKRWNTTNNGDALVREVEYARYKHPATLRSITCAEPSLLDQAELMPAVIAERSQNANFTSYMNQLACLPIAPVATAATGISANAFTAHWNAAADATGYHLTVNGGAPIILGNVTSYNITNILTAGNNATYTVQATNARGPSAASNTINVLGYPATPVTITATQITGTGFRANWNAAPNATSYILTIDGGAPINLGNVTSYLISGLVLNSSHSYSVQAVNATGTSPASNTTSVTLAATYATWNPASIEQGPFQLSNGNLKAVTTGTNIYGIIQGSIGVTTGRWYWEGTLGSDSDTSCTILGMRSSTHTYGYYALLGYLESNLGESSYGATFGAGDRIGIAFDGTSRQITFYKNGVSQGVAATGIPAGTFYPYLQDGCGSFRNVNVTANFGQNAFAYSVPSGFNAGIYTP